MYVKKGRYSGTFAHRDIAFEFASAISPVFKLYLIKEFQRLKEEENDRGKIEWDAKRFLSKNNFYAEEADILNVALFGFKVKAWRELNPELAKHSNIRDFATINELTVLLNLEMHNAQMIREGKNKEERFEVLQEIAVYQLGILDAADSVKTLPEK